MKKIKYVVTFFSLFLFSLLFSFQATGEGLSLRSFSPKLAFHFDWFGNPDRLQKLEITQRILSHIQEGYVEPDRVNPEEMFKKALDEVAQNVAEVRTIYPEAHRAILVVNNQRTEFRTDFKNLYALQTSLSDALKFVRENRQSEVSDQDLENLSIAGFLSTLDPHSVYLTGELFNETKVGTTGKFGGLGIVIGLRNNVLTIINVLDNTPAFKALLKSNDQIVKIGDEPTLNMNLNDAVNKMRGPKGSSVTLSVLRQGWTQEKPFTLIRDIINIVSVDSHLLPKGVGYVHVKNFQANTVRDLEKHLQNLTKEAGGKLSSLILDLRNDPGGLLDQAIGVTDKFLSDGPIVSTVGAGNHLREVEKATEPGTEPNYPMAVLIDQGSASASEIVAGALKQRDRAIVIGQRSFGKGSVQSLFELPEDSALKLTIAQYLTPGDFSIQSVGIEPDLKLTPAIVSKDYIDLYRKKYFEGEVTLEHHLSNPTSSKSALSDMEVHYLEAFDENEDRQIAKATGKQSSEEMLNDFYIKTAFDVLQGHSTANKAELLKAAKEYTPQAQKAQEVKIAEALRLKGIDWTPSPKKTTDNCPLPQASWKMVSEKNKAIQAGDTAKLTVTLKNLSRCTLYQTHASTDSKNYLFNNHEFLFGKMGPNQEITRESKIIIPKSMPNAVALFQINFMEANAIAPKPIQGEVSIAPIEKPKFAFSAHLKDSNGKYSKGNGDGRIQKGESIEIQVHVKNIGKVVSEQAVASLRTINEPQIETKFGKYTIPSLKPGEEKEYSFELDIPNNYLENNFRVEFSLFDAQYRVALNKRFNLDVATTQTGRAPAAGGSLTSWVQAPTLKLNSINQNIFPSSTQFLELKGAWGDSKGLKDMYIMVNGKKVFYQTLEQHKSQNFSASIPLEYGLNRIAVAGRNNSDLFSQDMVVIQRLTESTKGRGELAQAKDTQLNDSDFALDPLTQ